MGAGLYSWLLYRRDRNLADVDKRIVWLMAGARFLTVFLLGVLLLGPLFKSLNKRIEKPIIILALDNSASVPVNSDSSFYYNDFPGKAAGFVKELSGKYDVHPYLFGDRVKQGIDLDYQDKFTDYSALWQNLQARYANRNVGALVLASDGMYNRGQNPVYSIDPPYPLY
jgi:hypothetical protein